MADTPRCPHCGSANTSTSVDYKIKKGLGYAAEFGIGFLAGRIFGEAGADMVEDVSIADGVDKEWQCNNCGYKWNGKAVSSTSPSQLGTAKSQKTKASTPPVQQKAPKQYNKQDRAKLLEIIYKCDGRGAGWNIQDAFIQDANRLYEELHKQSIDISKSKIHSVNSYRRLADIILDRGWTYATYSASSIELPQNKTIKVVCGTGEEIEVKVTEDPHGLRLKPFSMTVKDAFSIEGRGIEVTGKIESGYITIGDRICFNNNPKSIATIVGIEIRQKILNYAEFNDYVGLLLSDVNYEIKIGDNINKKEVAISSSQENSISESEQEYLDELKECLTDGEIGGSERRLLNKLRFKLGISEEKASELEASLQKPQLTEEEQEYLEAYQDAMEDGVISEKERRLLDKLMKINNISEARAKEIEMLNN